MSDNHDQIARGKAIAESGKYAPRNSRHNGQYDDVPPPEPPEPADPGPAEEDAAEGAIQHRLHVLRINREAKRRLDDETRPPLALPPVKNLETLLAEPDNPTRYRIEGLAPAEGRVMLSAQYKAGKTTLRDNLIRALVDDEPFLGHFNIHTPARGLVVIDNEMSENTLRRWLRDQNITNQAAVADVISLRGRVGLFDLTDDRRRAGWADRLRDICCDYLILDCLRPVLDALGLSEDKDAGRFLVAFDALLSDAGVADAAIVHHMGHNSERARGDSRLQDWPDAVWRLFRADPDDPTSARYFSAVGRDVSIPEGRLSYDVSTRHMTYTAGSRSDTKTEAARVAVIGALAAADEPLSGRGIETVLDGEYPRSAIRAAVAGAVRDAMVTASDGPRGAKLHAIAHPCAECGMPVTGGAERHLSCPSSPEELAL